MRASADGITLRAAVLADLSALTRLEERSFSGDRLSRRSFRRWIDSDKGLLLVAEREGNLLGYGLVLLHQGTRLARLYSLALDASARGLGLGSRLLEALEAGASQRHRLYMRLEVEEGNQPAIALYERFGYRQFGVYPDYYEDHGTALRMQKCIRKPSQQQVLHPARWYQQTTEFTCGPSALLMAMCSQREAYVPERREELDIWRQATTIFMTTGNGGCHPIGLALAALRRGFSAEVIVNTAEPLFIDGVRSSDKKSVIELVDREFRSAAAKDGIPVTIVQLNVQHLRDWFLRGFAILLLISTYRLAGRKAPHWVTVTAMDDECLYVHDPDVNDDEDALDCQHVPIALEDFASMASYGANKMRTAVAIKSTQ